MCMRSNWSSSALPSSGTSLRTTSTSSFVLSKKPFTARAYANESFVGLPLTVIVPSALPSAARARGAMVAAPAARTEPQDGPRFDHVAEPRLLRRGRLAAEERRGHAREPQRRHLRGLPDDGQPRLRGSVPPGVGPRPARLGCTLRRVRRPRGLPPLAERGSDTTLFFKE